MFVLTIHNFKRQVKVALKIILLCFILCYVLPKLFMLFLSIDAPRHIPAPEKPMRVMLNNFKILD
jgi:hypothetical protein